MPLITKQDLYTELYPEIIEEITREDDTIVDKIINMAEGEVKSYLSRYDVLQMFSGTFNDQFLKALVTDVACWRLIKIANPNINIELFRVAFEDAIKYFEKVQLGKVTPGWPSKPNDPTTPIDESGLVEWNSNPKRHWHY